MALLFGNTSPCMMPLGNPVVSNRLNLPAPKIKIFRQLFAVR